MNVFHPPDHRSHHVRTSVIALSACMTVLGCLSHASSVHAQGLNEQLQAKVNQALVDYTSNRDRLSNHSYVLQTINHVKRRHANEDEVRVYQWHLHTAIRPGFEYQAAVQFRPGNRFSSWSAMIRGIKGRQNFEGSIDSRTSGKIAKSIDEPVSEEDFFKRWSSVAPRNKPLNDLVTWLSDWMGSHYGDPLDRFERIYFRSVDLYDAVDTATTLNAKFRSRQKGTVGTIFLVDFDKKQGLMPTRILIRPMKGAWGFPQEIRIRWRRFDDIWLPVAAHGVGKTGIRGNQNDINRRYRWVLDDDIPDGFFVEDLQQMRRHYSQLFGFLYDEPRDPRGTISGDTFVPPPPFEQIDDGWPAR